MATPIPSDHSRAALRSLIWRVVVFFVAAMAVVAAFVIAWRVGAFSPSRRAGL
jgi:L-asparagine transporter-like permease